MQKSSTIDGTNTQVNFTGENPANFMPPKIEISGIEAKRVPPRPHKLKPRDMNVLTPSGFWNRSSCPVTALFINCCPVCVWFLIYFPTFLFPLSSLPPCKLAEAERNEDHLVVLMLTSPSDITALLPLLVGQLGGLQFSSSAHHPFPISSNLMVQNKTSYEVTSFVIN